MIRLEEECSITDDRVRLKFLMCDDYTVMPVLGLQVLSSAVMCGRLNGLFWQACQGEDFLLYGDACTCKEGDDIWYSVTIVTEPEWFNDAMRKKIVKSAEAAWRTFLKEFTFLDGALVRPHNK